MSRREPGNTAAGGEIPKPLTISEFSVHLIELGEGARQDGTRQRSFLDCCYAFGPERAMFESNFPVDKGSCGYAPLWNAFKRITAGCSAAEKAALFAGTATKFYRLG